MKKILTFLATLAIAMNAVAQSPDILSPNHAMLRFDATGRYLLLPVSEKEDNAHVRVIDDNRQVQAFNVKLAIDDIDYCVPFDLQQFKGKNILFDVKFNDAKHAVKIDNYACWDKMTQTETFDTANREQFRPKYHHTPLYGWMNDPNGMFYKDGIWHLYFQYNPYGSQWENMTWGHSTSTDLMNWQAQPNAIMPDDLGSIFSGSCVVDKNNTAGFGKDAVVAIYTSAEQNQTQSIAYSTDGGMTFKKYSQNPIITAGIPDFRDPKVFWNEHTNQWNMVLAAGQEVRFYSSNNLKQWKYESSFGKTYGNHGGVWECPDIFEMDAEGQTKKWVLIVNINPGGPFGGSATQYFVGQFDGHAFTCESKPEVTKWLDYGKDHYATVTFSNAPDNRHVALAWMSNWQYANQVPTKQFRSANSIARDLILFSDGDETYVGNIPSPEMLSARGSKQKKLSNACEVVVDLKGTAQIVFANTKGEQVVMEYDKKAHTFSMDRTQSGISDFSNDFKAKTVAPTYGDLRQVRIFIDACSMEVFDSKGRMTMTNLVFPTEPYNTVKVKGGKATIYAVGK